MRIIILLFFITIISCDNNEKISNETFQIKKDSLKFIDSVSVVDTFSTELWMDDTLGLKGYRMKFIYHLQNDSIVGMSKGFIIKKFGLPDFSIDNGNIYIYCCYCDNCLRENTKYKVNQGFFDMSQIKSEKSLLIWIGFDANNEIVEGSYSR